MISFHNTLNFYRDSNSSCFYNEYEFFSDSRSTGSNSEYSETLLNKDYPPIDLSIREDDDLFYNTNKNENNENSSTENTTGPSKTKTKIETPKSKIFSITKTPKKNSKKNTLKEETPKFLGKKRTAEKEKHTKFAFDNIVRKIKSKLFDSLLIILNKSLEEKNSSISPALNQNQRVKKAEVKYECFLKPEQSLILQTNIRENLELLNKPLREILSADVSTKAKNYSKLHSLKYNKIFIEKIKNDENKRKTNQILDMTFFQCLEHFRGTKKYESLKGLEKEYDKVIKEMNDDQEYKENFVENLKIFEEMYANKRPRNRNKKEISNELAVIRKN